ncbi:MAG: hypothetical protein AAGA99_21890 [Actinomycetota bacterium]
MQTHPDTHPDDLDPPVTDVTVAFPKTPTGIAAAREWKEGTGGWLVDDVQDGVPILVGHLRGLDAMTYGLAVEANVENWEVIGDGPLPDIDAWFGHR